MPSKLNTEPNHWLRILFLLLLGSTITFTVMLGLLHWSLAAFLAFGAALPFGFLLAPGLVLGGGLALVVISYLVITIWDFLITAQYQKMEPFVLVETLLKLSNQYQIKYKKSKKIQDLLAAQTIIDYILKSWKSTKVTGNTEQTEDLQTNIPTFLPKTIRLILNKKLSNWTKSKKDKDMDQTLTELFKQYIDPTGDKKQEEDQKPKTKPNLPNTLIHNNLRDTSSLREQYSPEQQIDLLFHTPAEIKFIAKIEVKQERPETLPVKLTHWVKGLSLTHQVDQHQQQQHVIAQEEKIDISLDAKMEAGLEIDAAQHLSYQNAYKIIKNANKFSNASFLDEIKQKIHATPGIGKDTPFCIAPEVVEILKKANNYHRDTSSLDLEKLASGIVLVRNKQGGISLIHQKQDKSSKEQKNDLLLDYLDDIKEIDSSTEQKLYDQDPEKFKEDFLKEIQKKDILLSEEEQKFIDSIVNNKKLDKQHKVYIIHALRCVNEHLKKEDVHTTMTGLIACANKNFIDSTGKEKNLLSAVAYCFYQARFNNPKAIQYLLSLAQCNDAELRWFDALTRDYPTVFEDAAKGFFYFINFFKTQGIPLPDKTKIIKNKFRESSFGILTKALDLISLAKSKELQSGFIAELPRDLMVAKAQLRAGYTVVHTGMYFDICPPNGTLKFEDFFTKLADPFIIAPDELKSIDYDGSKEGNPLFYRALFLRYAALHGNSEDFVAALKEWKKDTGEDLYSCLSELEERWDAMSPDAAGRARTQYLKGLNTKLKQHWPQLKEYLLSLNKGLSVQEHKQTSTQSDSPLWLIDPTQNSTNKQYNLTDAKALLSKLGITKEEEADLLEDLKYLNSNIKQPTTDTEFRKAITQAKTELKELKELKDKKEATPLLKCLALMREAHYRISQAKTPEGQWLRLEQAIVILLALRKDTLFQIDTSEGKTLILQWLALLKALPGKKGNVLTHNESLAEESVDSLKPLASLFGIKVAKKTDTSETIIQADILYIDAATAVINEKLAQFAQEKDEKQDEEEKDTPKQPGARKADFALVDEVDNVVIDIHAGTSMQISEASDEADPELEAFLTTLNTLIRTTLPEKIKTKADEFTSKEAQREFIKKELDQNKSQAYYKKYCQDPEHTRLDFWISAAATAAQLKEKEDYVIESETVNTEEKASKEKKQEKEKREVVHILHKETTGRVDKISQWGAGVHQCVAAWEKSTHPRMKISGLSHVIAEGDVAHHLQTQYRSRCGFTGTLGEPTVQTTMQSILKTEATVIMPRAKKMPPEEAAWPQVPLLETKTTEPRYNRRYDFPPQVYKAKEAHLTALLEAVRSIQTQNLSGMLFFNTVKECEEFADFLTLNGIDTNTLQILDDTHPEPGEGSSGENKLRPSEATVITQAKTKQQITLTTAAGSRGTDFKGVDVGIVTKPSLWRVLLQKLGRLGRNKDFGVTYEIYCEQDLGGDPFKRFFPKDEQKAESDTSKIVISDTNTKEEKAIPSPSQQQNRFRFFMQPYEESKQARDLANIHTRATLRAFKQGLQADFVAHRHTAKDKKQLNTAWANFFGQIDLHWQTNQKDSDKIEALCKQCFTETSWKEDSLAAVQTQFKAATTRVSPKPCT